MSKSKQAQDEADEMAIAAHVKLWKRGKITRRELTRRIQAFMPDEPMAIITVRMDKNQHLALKASAEAAGLSLNQLCVNRLMAPEEIGGESAEEI